MINIKLYDMAVHVCDITLKEIGLNPEPKKREEVIDKVYQFLLEDFYQEQMEAYYEGYYSDNSDLCSMVECEY